jgi:RNA polymerase sigma factor (sigma-70 family)
MPSPFSSAFARLAGRPYDPATDRELITRFHHTRDESAFASLVQKHGPMVLGVCRRRLRDPHAADDAFQATFLVLARKAGSVRWQESLAGWLYRVATHVCRKATTRSATRSVQPLPADTATAAQPPPSELSAVLDAELQALPASYRDPIVLCHLQGYTTEEAARLLGLTDGQLRGRLFRGRDKLRDRLTRRGVALSVSALVVSLTAASARAVPPALGGAAVSVALSEAVVSASVLTLTHEVLSAMSRTKFHLLVGSLALFGGLTLIGVVLNPVAARSPVTQPPVAQTPPKTDNPVPPAPVPKGEDDEKKPPAKLDVREGVIKSVDAAANRLVVTTDEDKFDLPVEVSKLTEVVVARKAVKLADLKAGMRAEVSFDGATAPAVKVEASWPTLRSVVRKTDAPGGQLTIKTDGDKGFEFDVTLDVAKDARVELDGLPAGLDDVRDRKVELEFGLDKKTVHGVSADAEPGELSATVKAVDPANKAVTLTVLVAGERSERKVDLSFPLADTCAFRIAGRDMKPADWKPEMPALCRFAADRRTITAIWAGPPRPKEKDDD